MADFSDNLSRADRFLLLPREERERRLASLDISQLEFLRYDWDFWARPKQVIPGGDWWSYWLVQAGRGFGKTRVGAETTRKWSKNINYVNLIGATVDDARDIMIEGESGILAVCPKNERPRYVPSKRKLEWPNGAVSLIFTADEPERLRGKQHGGLWCDELGAWRYPESWDQAKFGLRLGTNPRAVITTTPRPTELVRKIINDPATVRTLGTTYENRANLAPTFFNQIIKTYEGTRIGRQEILAEILDDNPGALWKHEWIESARVQNAPELQRIVVAIDPAVTSNADSDETGIIVVGIDNQDPQHFYVLRDASCMETPDKWAQNAIREYANFQADRMIAEVNNGGDLVKTIIRQQDPCISYEDVRATRGKQIRAEPVSSLYEQRRVHHVGSFPKLEDQMTQWDPADPSAKSPDRLDALVWGITYLSMPLPNAGYMAWIKRQQPAKS